MSVKLLIKHHLDFLSLTGGCTGSSESTIVKIPLCWKSHVTAHIEYDKEECNIKQSKVLSATKELIIFLEVEQ